MKRAGVGAAVVLVLALVWLLADSAGVFRAERRTTEHAESRREGVADSTATDESGDDRSKESADTPALPAPVDLSKVDLDLDLHGIVVDENDQPVAGANLQTVFYPAQRASTLNVDDRYVEVKGPSTRSASDGTFAMRLKRGSLWNLRADATGRCATEIREVSAGERIKVVLPPGVALIVVARDEQKQPVPAVRVRVFSNASSATQITRVLITDEQGIARFEGMPPGIQIWIDPEHATLGNPGWKKLVTKPVAEQRFELTMPNGRTLTGRVTDAETGAPIPGARVGMNWVMLPHTLTNKDGEYALPGWTGDGTSDIAADAPEYAFEKREVGDESRIDFALAPGGAVSGRIVDPGGLPIGNARVDAIGSQRIAGQQVISHRHTSSAKDGTFRLKGLRTKFPLTLVVIAEGFGRKLVPCDAKRPETVLGDVILSVGRSIEGVVMSGDQPLTRVAVTLTSKGPDAPPHSYGAIERRFTDHLGRFRFPDQTPGPFQLRARPKGAGEIQRDVILGADRDLVGVELRLPEGRAFTVWVHDEQGAPIKGATCDISHTSDGRMKSLRAQTDAAGAARFLVSGPVGRVNPPRLDGPIKYAPAEAIADVPPSATEVRFVLEKGATITGTVLLGGEPVPLPLVEVWRKGKQLSMQLGTDKGTFEVVGPRDEPVDLIVRRYHQRGRNGGITSDGLPPLEGRLDGVAPGATDVVIAARAIPTDAKVTVRVLDADGQPIAKASVSVGGARGTTGADGTIAFEGLPRSPTRVYVHVAAPPGQLPPGPLDITPSGQEVVMRLEKGVPVTGTVLGPDGTPGRFIVTAMMGKRYLASVGTDSEGRFTVYVPEEPAEKVTIEARWRDKAGKNYTAQAEYVPGAAILLRLEKR